MGRVKNKRRELDNEAKVVLKNLRISPQKLNLTLQMIRKEKADNDKKFGIGLYTKGTLQSKNFYTFTVWLVAGVDESSKQLIYTKNRIGTNSGDENFSWIFEGTARNNEEQVRAKVV